ncbi:Flp family type IVb pilin [Hyphomonas sp.]|uniref:Flp family type IVb pilin n=1 Tax=Hyphomonas sp. TaxID=87 RepID=UPI003341048D
MTKYAVTIKHFLADECGASAVEYGLIAALIIVGLLAGLTNVADANKDTYQMIEDKVAI